MSLDRAEVARHLLRIRDASESFLGFVRLRQPNWKIPPFQLELIDTLDRFEKDELGCRNLLITMPPRHSKSTVATVLFPAYCIARKPTRYTMTCSYNAELATDFGRQVRAVVEDPVVTQAFPAFTLSRQSHAADVWRTEDGGAYFAVGLGGTTSGRPANILITDDPIKARADAESRTQRDRTWDYYTSALMTRLQPEQDGQPPRQIVILTRWHPDDLAGRLMASDDWKEGHWKHVNFPALITDPDGTERPLWPERFPLDDLLRRRRQNPREFASLYQQEPYILGGNLIKSEWWQRYDTSDLVPETDLQTIIITADTAFKKNETADYSVFVTAGMDQHGDIYILDVTRGRWEFPDLKKRLIQQNVRWRGRGLRATYVEDKASGQSLIQELRRESGIAVIARKVVNDKVSRVNAILPIVEGGRVFIPEQAAWVDDFLEETVTFPGGTHDDQVDAVTMAIDVLSRTSVAADVWEDLNSAQTSLNQIHSPAALGKSLSQLAQGIASRPWNGWGQ